MAQNYTVQEATAEDVPAMVDCFFAAFKDDAIVGEIDKHVDPQARNKKFGGWLEGLMKEAEQGLCGVRYFKAVDANGTLAGFGKWLFPHTLTATQQTQRSAIDAAAKANPPPDLPGTNVSLQRDFFGQLNARRQKHTDPKTDYFMHILAILPEHQRKGLGALLLRHVLDMADEQGKRCYIEASKAGLELYRKLGWTEVDEICVDMGVHGCEGGIVRQKCLMREPVIGR